MDISVNEGRKTSKYNFSLSCRYQLRNFFMFYFARQFTSIVVVAKLKQNRLWGISSIPRLENIF